MSATGDKDSGSRCEAESTSTTMDDSPNCSSHQLDLDNTNIKETFSNDHPFSSPDVRWHPEDAQTSGIVNNPFNPAAPESPRMAGNVTIVIDGDCDNSEEDSPAHCFQFHPTHHDDIAQVLENFNSILDNIDLTYNSEQLDNCSANGHDGDPHDEEEFLIVVDENVKDGMAEDDAARTASPAALDIDDPNCCSSGNGSGIEDHDQEEGYESDRPMVRASMRKLKPVQMLPMPPASAPESPNHQIVPGFATTLNSPMTNRILVTSLINTVLAPSYNASCSVESSSPTISTEQHGTQNTTIAASTGSRSQCHSRSHSQNNPFITAAVVNASDLTSSAGTNTVIDLVDGIADSSQIIQQNHRRLNSSSSVVLGEQVQQQQPQQLGSTTSDNLGMSSVNFPREYESQSCNYYPSALTTNPVAIAASTVLQDLGNNGVFVETVQIGAAVMNTQSASNASTAPTASTDASRRTSTSTTNPSPPAGARRNARNQHVSATGVSPGRWPHRLSSVLALIGCTLGLNNICRFGLLSVEYGANFTIQFIFLSLVFGIPLLTFHMSSGQYLASGIIDMWKISPIFQGIGIGLVISQAMIGIYTAVGVSWMFIYFRDSFITRYDLYRWAKCFRDYRDCDQYLYNSTQLSETVPDYFNGVVLQRGSPDYPSSSFPSSSLKFTVAFNLAVVWMLIFVSLSKGLKSYGKAIHGFVLVPVAAILVLASKMVGLVPSDETSSLFGQTDWNNFFFNSQTWVIAAREAFFTWGLLGACVMQVTSHNRPTHSLKSDASIVILITTFVLFLSAFLGNACYSVLVSHGYTYVSSSFESDQTYKFLIRKSPENLLPSSQSHHTSFLMGVRIVPPSNIPNGSVVSGYQVLRLATELFPATMAVLGAQGLSPFWTVLFYFTFVLFGIAQQLAIWYCVIKGVIAIKAKTLKSWETTITFFVCALGFLLGLPLCTEFGIFVEYFLDYAIGSGWWIMVLYLLELVAVFIVRGAPYCGENIVTVLMTGRGKLTTLMAPLISFLWNVILPVAMLVLSITSFKNGNIRELYDWNPLHGYAFWPSWTREIGTLIQLLPILTVPFVAIVQSCRYLTNGPPDLFDRMQQLYRPHSRGLLGRTLSAQLGRDGSRTNSSNRNNTQERTSVDPPPKYTPPPSYSTATSARIAKFLRTSLRRSLRRLPGGSRLPVAAENQPPPPNYASVILEINSQSQQDAAATCSSAVSTTPTRNPIIAISPPGESCEIGTSDLSDPSNKPVFKINLSQCHTLGRILEPDGATAAGKTRGSLRRIASDITPREVARILRASFRQEQDGSDISTNEKRKDFVMGNELTATMDHLPSSGFHNFDFSRKRRSNDSQLALISPETRNNSLEVDNELPYYSDLMDLGILSPPQNSGHLRSNSLTVPLPTTSSIWHENK